jgi:hypothetical protein
VGPKDRDREVGPKDRDKEVDRDREKEVDRDREVVRDRDKEYQGSSVLEQARLLLLVVLTGLPQLMSLLATPVQRLLEMMLRKF